VDPTQLVAVRVANVCKIDGSHCRLTWTGSILDRRAAIRESSRVKQFYLFRRVARESDGAAVGHGCWFIVDRLADDEVRSALVAVKDSNVSTASYVRCSFPYSQGAEYGVVELPRPFDIIRANHCMKKQIISPKLSLSVRNQASALCNCSSILSKWNVGAGPMRHATVGRRRLQAGLETPVSHFIPPLQNIHDANLSCRGQAFYLMNKRPL